MWYHQYMCLLLLAEFTWPNAAHYTYFFFPIAARIFVLESNGLGAGDAFCVMP